MSLGSRSCARTLLAVAALAIACAPPLWGASAHDPCYQDRSLWPSLKGDEYFLKQEWPQGRLLVWAQPGKSGGIQGRRGMLDVTDPKNWLENGRAPDSVILDENTDILLPASDTEYRVGFRGTPIREVCRHVTIESGAGFVGGGDGRGRLIHGNVWVRKGGKCDVQGATNFLGAAHTFFRNDNRADTEPPGSRKHKLMCSQYFTFNKVEGASVEFLGHVTVLDEFRIYGCAVIVGRDSILQPGRHATPSIDRGGVLALLDGAYFGSWCNNWGIPDMTVVRGTIQGGLRDRPLARGCRFGLGMKNHTAAAFVTPGTEADERTLKRWGDRLARVPSLLVRAGSLRSYSTDLATARLTFSVMPDGVGDRSALHIRPLAGTEEEKRELEREPDAAKRFAWFDALPRGIDCYLARDVAVDGVAFDHLRRGGILCEDLAARAAWKNIAFGPDCAAKGDEAFSPVAEIGKNGQY